MIASTLSSGSVRDPLRWSEHGACLDAPDLPWIGDDPAPAHVAAMAAVCVSCPVRLACGAHAHTADVTAGFWAGAYRDPAPTTSTSRASSRTSTTRPAVVDLGAGSWEPVTLPGLELPTRPSKRMRRGAAA